MTAHPALARRPRELVQLAGVWRGGLDPFGAMVEEKIDGVRAAWIGGQLLTREGIPIGGTEHIAWRIRSIERACGTALFLDGEFLVDGDYMATLSHIGHGAGAREQGTLHLFDCLTAADWESDACDRRLVERKAMLQQLVAMADDPALSWDWRPGTRGKEPDGPALAIVEDQWCADARDVEQMALRIWSAGGEGVMVKDAESVYRRGRNSAWRKYKREGWSMRKLATPVRENEHVR